MSSHIIFANCKKISLDIIPDFLASYSLMSFRLLLYNLILKSAPAMQNMRIFGTTLKDVSGLHAIA